MGRLDRGRWHEHETRTLAEHGADSRSILKKEYDARRKIVGRCPMSLMRTKRRKLIVGLIGGACQICKYNRYSGSLAFHHESGSDKLGEVSQFFNTKLPTLFVEIGKCALICHNCHNEAHAGMISKSLIHQAVKKTRLALASITARSWAELGPQCNWRTVVN